MASDDGRALSERRLAWLIYMSVLDGARPSRPLSWVGQVAPVVTQGAVGAGHWAAGRRRRALAAWAGAAGFGLAAWGLGTEAPAAAEVRENTQRLLTDFFRTRGQQAPDILGMETHGPPPIAQRVAEVAFPVLGIVIGVPWDLRHPRRLTVLTILKEAPNVAIYGLRAARAGQRRRPRIAVGSALIVAASVARLRAASAEPLR